MGPHEAGWASGHTNLKERALASGLGQNAMYAWYLLL